MERENNGCAGEKGAEKLKMERIYVFTVGKCQKRKMLWRKKQDMMQCVAFRVLMGLCWLLMGIL